VSALPATLYRPAAGATARSEPALAAHHAALEGLCEGGDARVQQPYGLTVPAADRLVHFGSCTANPITPATVLRHQRMRVAHAFSDPQTKLRLFYGADQCMLAASGTDAEYSVAVAMGAAPYLSILMDPNEIGSGCARAAAGLPHVAGCPVEAPLPVQPQVHTASLRDEAGRPLPSDQVDQQVRTLAADHAALPLLLHHVPCSKTGLSAPSEACCLTLQRQHPAGARVVVDASQGRFTQGDVRRWLGHGWAVILTGSKYFGAPPFCGATLFPPGWPPAFGFPASAGLKARWRLALPHLSDAPPPLGAWSRLLTRHFLPQLGLHQLDLGDPLPLAASAGTRRIEWAGQRLSDAGRVDRQGILSFDLGLDKAAATRLHRALIQRGYFIGQPVTAGPRTLLRVAIGAGQDLALAAPQLERLAQAIAVERQRA
jgi:hypothetical protein